MFSFIFNNSCSPVVPAQLQGRIDALSKSLDLVERSSEKTFVNDDNVDDDVHVAELGQIAGTLSSLVSERLLDASVQVTECKRYWRETRSSTYKIALYWMESLPANLSLLYSIDRSSMKPTDLQLLFLAGLSPSMQTQKLSFLFPISSPFHVARVGFNIKLARLEKIERLLHYSIGLLAEASTTHPLTNGSNNNSCITLPQIERMLQSLETVTANLSGLSKPQEFDNFVCKTLEVEAETGTSPSIKELCLRAQIVASAFGEPTAAVTTTFTASLQVDQPYWTSRIWLPLALFSSSALLLHGILVPNLPAIKSTLQDAYQTAALFVRDYVVTPLHGIYNIVRHKEQRLALMGQDSLQSDLESLERMVFAFAKDHGATDANLQAITERVQRGDLTVVLQKYEDEMKHPFWNSVSGDLVRSLLIQAQKAKVDLELAMAALDKLLRANELNFAFLAVVPTILGLSFAYTKLRQIVAEWLQGGKRRVFVAIKSSLREVERTLNRSISESIEETLPTSELGALISQVNYIRKQISAVPSKYRDYLVEDVAELISPGLSIRQKLNVCCRMHSTYPFVFV